MGSVLFMLLLFRLFHCNVITKTEKEILT